MTMILDVATTLTSPDSMILFDDTSHRTVHYAPREWRLGMVGGRPGIQYNEWPSDDVAFMQVVLAPFVDRTELNTLKQAAAAKGISVQAVRYLGKNDTGGMGAQITVPYTFPLDPKFRFEVNGGQGGSFANPVAIVFSCNLRTGRILRDIVRDTKQAVGLAFQISNFVRGATTTFHAVVTVDYDRTYEMLSIHHSWKWWIWSGDFQAAWQTLTSSGGVTVEILGGTADQKTIAYKMAEWLRDMFIKAEIGNVTTPSHPNTGIINTSVRYEKQHEHKKFRVEFNERDFTEAPFATIACTGNHTLGAKAATDGGDDMLRYLYDMSVARGSRVDYDEIPSSFMDGMARVLRVEGSKGSMPGPLPDDDGTRVPDESHGQKPARG